MACISMVLLRCKMVYTTQAGHQFNTAFKILFNKYYLDEIYFRGIVDPIFATAKSFLWKFVDVKVIDGVINGTASLTTYLGSQVRKIQTGFAQSYAVYMIAGAVIILTIFVNHFII